MTSVFQVGDRAFGIELLELSKIDIGKDDHLGVGTGLCERGIVGEVDIRR